MSESVSRETADAAHDASGREAPREPAATNSPARPTAEAPLQYRFSWPEPTFDDARLKANQLGRYSNPLIDLITDLPEDDARRLLPLVEKIMPVWLDYFGPLPPARDGSRFHMTGSVMRDRELFVEAKLLPEALPLSFHGRQIGNQFWMNRQDFDYYQRHLFLHEATHVFMRHLPGCDNSMPLWYLEGLAETLATHRTKADGGIDFNVMPKHRSEFDGHERLEIVRREVAAGRVPSIKDIMAYSGDDFAKVEAYAWCWALCRFLDSHPRYSERFRRVARELNQKPMTDNMTELFRPDRRQWHIDWHAFAASVDAGYDFERMQFPAVVREAESGVSTFVVNADRGWQATGLRVNAGEKLDVMASGRIVLANEPREWISEANGITFRYVNGRPIGQLLAMILSETDADDDLRQSFARVEPLGNSTPWTAPASGLLFLRVNDAPGELADNRGHFDVHLRQVK